MLFVLSSMKEKVGRVRVRRNHLGDGSAGRRMTPASRTANASGAAAPTVRSLGEREGAEFRQGSLLPQQLFDSAIVAAI
jgi:hypothetical protein